MKSHRELAAEYGDQAVRAIRQWARPPRQNEGYYGLAPGEREFDQLAAVACEAVRHGRLALALCECADIGCPVHHGVNACDGEATGRLYRIDMLDESGTPMCEACADDAFSSGLFRSPCELDSEGWRA